MFRRARPTALSLHSPARRPESHSSSGAAAKTPNYTVAADPRQVP